MGTCQRNAGQTGHLQSMREGNLHVTSVILEPVHSRATRAWVPANGMQTKQAACSQRGRGRGTLHEIRVVQELMQWQGKKGFGHLTAYSSPHLMTPMPC